MLRVLVGVSRILRPLIAPTVQNVVKRETLKPTCARNFTTIVSHQPPSLLAHPRLIQISNNITRGLIKFSFRKGKRKSVRIVLQRFYRLHWGGWIRTKCGRQKKLWKKSPPRKRRLRQHVLCNASQSMLLDKMVGPYWTKPRFYVDDPYEPYHSREEFKFTYTKPKPFSPPE